MFVLFHLATGFQPNPLFLLAPVRILDLNCFAKNNYYQKSLLEFDFVDFKLI